MRHHAILTAHLPHTQGCTRVDIDQYFKAANIESADFEPDDDEEGVTLDGHFVTLESHEGQEAQDDLNDDNALMRFEFVEVVLRLAIGHYLRQYTKQGHEVPLAAAFDSFVLNHIQPVLKTPEEGEERPAVKPHMVELRDLLQGRCHHAR